jgi:hypothetical protein
MPDDPAAAQTSGSARRRRRRHPQAARPKPAPAAAADVGAAPAAEVPDVETPADTTPAPPRSPSGRRERDARTAGSGDRGLRELVGGGKSQLGVDGALRGRDVNRPTDADLAEAEQNVTIVRRHWTAPPNG